MKFFYQKLRLLTVLFILSGLCSTSIKAQLINEGFTTMVPLPTGWAQQNLSTPVGTTPNWFQGNINVFTAFNGPTNSYAGVNFNSVAGANTINNWLFTPTVAIANGNIFSFYTRVGTGGGQFPDRLQLRMSTNGASVDVGNTNTSVGDFTTLLVDVNPTLTTTGYPEVWTQFTATITGVAVPTTGRFAFRYFVTDGGPSGANSNYLGVDQVLYGAICTGTPAPGNTISTAATVCPAIPFTLSLQNPSAGPGITYQWQSSPDNIAWTNITGATNATLTTTQTASTWYRCNVTCTPNTGASSALQVTMNPPLSCYCIPGNTDCTLDDEILNVNFAGINNSSSGCTGTGYTNYAATVAPATVIAGGTFPMSVRVGPGGNEFVGAWIDANQNGVFETSEFTLVGAAASGGAGVTITGNVTVPANATITTTRMRVRVRFGTALTGANACIGYGFGETEDYSVTIVPCVPINITTQPANTTIQCGGDATFTVASTGSGPSYKWQEKQVLLLYGLI